MSIAEAVYECRNCRAVRPAAEMSRLHGKVAQPCRACKNIYARQFRETGTGTGTPSPTVDPCPVCGVPQAAHWRCRRCTSRGHLMGRGRLDGALCAWCDHEVNGKRGTK